MSVAKKVDLVTSLMQDVAVASKVPKASHPMIPQAPASPTVKPTGPLFASPPLQPTAPAAVISPPNISKVSSPLSFPYSTSPLFRCCVILIPSLTDCSIVILIVPPFAHVPLIICLLLTAFTEFLALT